MHEPHKPDAAARRRPLQHLLVAVGVAERKDWSPTDVALDADRLAFLVVDEIHLGESHKNGLAVANFEFRLDAAADDLLRRNSINLLRPWPHELDAAARHDVSFEPV